MHFARAVTVHKLIEMGKLTNHIFCFLLIVLLHGFAKGQSEVEIYLEKITELKSFSGSILVTKGDSILINRGFGFADFENNIVNTNTTVHRIGSLTKQLTSLGILKLLDDSLSIDDPINKFIPELPGDWNSVTIYHLLTHTSGIPDLFGEMDVVPVEETFKEIKKVLKTEPNLISNPGYNFRYNNFGYVLLGRLIEIISKQNYFDFLQEEILLPLGMKNTYYDDPRAIIKNRSEGYKLEDGLRQNDELKDPAAYSAGGILSSTSDLMKFSNALKSNIILSNKQRDLMFTPHLNNYGLGWQIIEKKGRMMYNHNGGTHGFNSRMVFYPEEEIFIAILGNNEDVRAAAITCDIESIIFKDKSHLLSIPYEIDPEELLQFKGTYYSDSGDEERLVFLKNNQLHITRGQSEFKLTPLSKNSFCYTSYEDIRIVFLNQNKFEISSCSVNPTVFRKK